MVLNVNDRQTSMVLGRPPISLLYGPGFIKDRLMGLTFRISPSSFIGKSVQTEEHFTEELWVAACDRRRG